jgi:hypothetical protein
VHQLSPDPTFKPQAALAEHAHGAGHTSPSLPQHCMHATRSAALSASATASHLCTASAQEHDSAQHARLQQCMPGMHAQQARGEQARSWQESGYRDAAMGAGLGVVQRPHLQKVQRQPLAILLRLRHHAYAAASCDAASTVPPAVHCCSQPLLWRSAPPCMHAPAGAHQHIRTIANCMHAPAGPHQHMGTIANCEKQWGSAANGRARQCSGGWLQGHRWIAHASVSSTDAVSSAVRLQALTCRRRPPWRGCRGSCVLVGSAWCC